MVIAISRKKSSFDCADQAAGVEISRRCRQRDYSLFRDCIKTRRSRLRARHRAVRIYFAPIFGAAASSISRADNFSHHASRFPPR